MNHESVVPDKTVYTMCTVFVCSLHKKITKKKKKKKKCLGRNDQIQSTLVISNSKGLYETLRGIRTSTYQICGNEENS